MGQVIDLHTRKPYDAVMKPPPDPRQEDATVYICGRCQDFAFMLLQDGRIFCENCRTLASGLSTINVRDE